MAPHPHGTGDSRGGCWSHHEGKPGRDPLGSHPARPRWHLLPAAAELLQCWPWLVFPGVPRAAKPQHRDSVPFPIRGTLIIIIFKVINGAVPVFTATRSNHLFAWGMLM